MAEIDLSIGDVMVIAGMFILLIAIIFMLWGQLHNVKTSSTVHKEVREGGFGRGL